MEFHLIYLFFFRASDIMKNAKNNMKNGKMENMKMNVERIFSVDETRKTRRANKKQLKFLTDLF